MRVRPIFALAAASAWVFGACGSSFTSAGDSGGASSGAAGRTSGGGSGVAGSSVGGSGVAGSSVGGSAVGGSGVGGTSASGSAGMPEAGSTGAACSKPADCPAQTSTCRVNVCKVLTHTCGAANRALGFACKEKGGLVCDGAGACVSTHCSDAVQDADETDVDCGGSCSTKCQDTAPQQKCLVNGDCVSGVCAGSPLLCQPACAASCAAPCESCSIPGQVGACAKLPPGVDDPTNFCLGQAVCDTGGACVSAQNQGHFGDACALDSDCFNGTCGAGFCRLRNGDACAEDAACKSGRCSANLCAACVDPTDCASGKCNAGICLLPGGYPCATAADCAGGACSFADKTCVQAGSEACSTEACVTHFCNNGNCQTCASSNDCPLGTACTGGSCLAPAGAYCTSATLCASGKCSASALLSMRKCQ